MGKDVADGGWQERGRCVRIDPRGQLCRGCGTAGKFRNDRSRPGPAVRDQPFEPPGRVADRGPVAGQEQLRLPQLQPFAGRHERAEIAIGR